MSTKVITVNIISNFLSRVWLGLVTLVSLPYIINQLGADAYGILSLSLLIIGYFSLLDMGLTRGVVKFLAEYNAFDDKEKIRKLIGNSLVLYVCLGIIGAVILGCCVKFFVNLALNIPFKLRDVSRVVFYLTSLGLLFRIPRALFVSIPRGYQKIHLLNIVNVIVNTTKILVTVVLLYFGFFLIAVVIANVIVELMYLFSLIFLSKKLLPSGALHPVFDVDITKKIFGFSLKAFVSDFMSIIIIHLDKLLISLFLPIANLAYYTVSFQLSSRVWEIPGNITSAIYPAFSDQYAKRNFLRFNELFVETSKLIMIGVGYTTAVIIFFSNHILGLWINKEFAQEGGVVLSILGVGVMVSSCAWVALTAANGAGRPDLPAKTHIIMAVTNLVLCVILIPLYGLKGAAWAWLLQHLSDIFIMIPWVNKTITGISNRYYLWECCLKPAGLGLLVAGIIFLATEPYITTLAILIVIVIGGAAVYYTLGYFIILSKKERDFAKWVLKGVFTKG